MIKGSKGKNNLTECEKLQNRVAGAIDKLLKTKLEIFADVVRVNMPELKKKSDAEIVKSLQHMIEHIYKL